MAFILGIFQPLVDAIRQIASAETLKLLLHFQIKELLRTIPWRFLVMLGIGILVAFAGFSKLVLFLLSRYPEPTLALFLGLIAASIVSIMRKMQHWNAPAVVSLLIGALIAYFVITLVPVSTPNIWYISFLCGVICICAMILPGISGSFLLLVLGQYQYIWGAIGDCATGKITSGSFNTIVFFGLGAVIGVGAFSHLLNYLFAQHHDVTVASLIGFMVGSVPRLWPWQQVTEVSVKIGNTVQKMGWPLASPLPAGAKVTPLVVKNIAPPDFGWGFWLVVLLAGLGVVIVFATEYAAATNEKKAE